MSNLWLNEPTDITSILHELCSYGSIGDLTHIEKIVARARDSIVRDGLSPRNILWRALFGSVASGTVMMINSKWDVDAFVNLLLTKHKRYGVKSISAWRELGILTRIDQKIARATNLKLNPELGEGDETVHDTLVDIVGYCVLGYYITTKLPKE